MKECVKVRSRQWLLCLLVFLGVLAGVFAGQVQAVENPFKVTLADGTVCEMVQEGTVTHPYVTHYESLEADYPPVPLYVCTVPEGTQSVGIGLDLSRTAIVKGNDFGAQVDKTNVPVITDAKQNYWIEPFYSQFYGLYFKTEAASDERATITAELSAQQENTFLLPHQMGTVTEGLATDYGYKNDAAHVGKGQVSALDALVAAHERILGDAFTKESAKDYLVVNDWGTITKMFGTKTNAVGFTVNGKTPHDDVLQDWGYTGYTINQAVIGDGDDVEFFIYQDTSYWTDYYAYFTQNGTRTTAMDAQAQRAVTLDLEGYMLMDEFSEHVQTGPLAGLEIVALDSRGNTVTVQGVSGVRTDSEGKATITFPEAGDYILSARATEDAENPVVNPWCVVSVGKAYPQTGYLGERTEAKVYDDFENDLWLQYDFKEMNLGDTADIYPRRLTEIVSGSTTNDVVRPTFHFEIIRGDSITLNTTKSDDKAVAKAVKAGDTVVKVTYDAITAYNKEYGANSLVNTAYVVFSVDGASDMAITTTGLDARLYDTLYYTEGDTVDYSFTAAAEGAKNLVVTCNGEALSATDGKYTAPLENRSNIIGIVATDAQGKTRSLYKVMDARKIEINISNTTHPEQAFTLGDTAKVSFRGIVHPVYKLATIYNPTWYSPDYGSNGTYVHYDNDRLGTVKGYCGQWDLATKNTITMTFDAGGAYTFDAGRIYSMWWGKELGYETTHQGIGSPGLYDPTHNGEFSTLPAFSITVSDPAVDAVADLMAKAEEAISDNAGGVEDAYTAVQTAYEALNADQQTSLKERYEALGASLTALAQTNGQAALADGQMVRVASADGKALPVDVKLIINSVVPNANTAAALQRYPNKDAVLTLGLSLMRGSEKWDNGHQPIQVTVPCSLEGYPVAEGKVSVCHVKADGSMEMLEGAYDAQEKTVTFTTSSFSDFIILADKAAVSAPDTSGDAAAGTTTGAASAAATDAVQGNAKTGLPESGSLLAVALLLMGSCGVILWGFVRKKI